MNYKFIIKERKGNIGIIKLSHPERRNAVNVQMMDEITSALKELDNDSRISVAVVASAFPGIYCAGGDLTETIYPDPVQQWYINEKLAQLWLTFSSVSIVIVASVNGMALGVGTGIVACSDLAVASEDAHFGFPEANFHSFPATMTPRMVRQCVGLRKCLEYYLTGETFDAREAERMGLVNKVVPPAQLEKATTELAQKVANKSSFAMRVGKRYFNSVQEIGYTEAMKYAVEFLTVLNCDPDVIEAKKAFLNRKK